MIETTGEEYAKLREKYAAYVDLYKFFNYGSTEGVTTFDEFYWRFTYATLYEDPTKVGVGNG